MKKEGYVVPVIVLTVICLVFGFLLSYVNSITSPIIEAAEAEAAELAKKEVLPDGDSFVEITDIELPEEIDQAFVAENGAGHVYFATGNGYGGPMQIIVGIDSDGIITGTKVLSHSETAGLGARVAEEEWNSQFPGQDSSLSGVSIISGSTISSNCFIELVQAAFEANDILTAEGV
jgi:electron transport complex protein RnfG